MVPQPTLQCSSYDVKLRFLSPSDIDIVRSLCKQWFPIKYPDSWYEDITSSNKYYTLAAIYDDKIVGVLVADIKPFSKCNYEDCGLLYTKAHEPASRVAYILTLGVVGSMRRHGIATLLLNKLIDNLTTNPMLEDCKALYLHVLTTNVAAINFYERLHFKRHKLLPLYYLINSAACDGYCYVLYINGGRPPPTVLGRLFRLCCLIFSFFPLNWTKLCSGIYSSIYRKFSHSKVKHKGHLYTC